MFQPNHKATLLYKPTLASPLKADVLTLSAFVRAESLAGNPHLRTTVHYTDGRKERLKIQITQANGDYHFVRDSLVLSGTVRSIKVEARYKNTSIESGYFWVDVISLLAGSWSGDTPAAIASDGLVPLPQAESALGSSSSDGADQSPLDLPSSLDSRGQP